MFGAKWFGPKPGSGIGPRTRQAWVVIGVYAIAVLGVVPMLHVESTVKHQLVGLATGLLIAIVLLTYKAD
jgi:hypothetical protein